MNNRIDDKINSLSSDELDLLNSDPQMLSDFKNKYSEPKGVMGMVGDAFKAQLPNPETYNQPISGSPTQAMGQLLNPAEGLTRAYATSRETGEAAGNAVEKFGNDIDHPVIGKVGSFITKTALDPATWVGMAGDILPKETIEKQAPALLDRLASMPKRATELKGYSLPTPSAEEVQQGVKNVQQTVSDLWKEHGNVLNDAKAASGLPITEDDVAASVRKYGNAFDVNLDKPLELPENYRSKAPKMEGENPKPDLPKVDPASPPVNGPYAVYRGSGFGGDFYDIYNSPLNTEANKQVTLSGPEALQKMSENNIPLVGKIEAAGKQLPTEPYGHVFKDPSYNAPMPFKIGPHDTPEQLMTEINRFKANQPYISSKDKVKAASYLQDQISQHVDWEKSGNRIQGVLKSQYNDLKNVITDSSPALQKAKAKMGGLYDIMARINKKLSAGEGQGEAYLRRLFTSKSAAVQDDLKALAQIEKLSGKPVVTELFKKFAGEAYGQVLGENVRSIFQLLHAVAMSPKYVISPLMKYGPGALNATKLGSIGAAERGFTMGQSNPDNQSELQSVRDRLNNAQ